MINRIDLGLRLKALRKARGMTQSQVAKYLGVSRDIIAKIELGNRIVTKVEMEKLADFYGQDAKSLVSEDFKVEDALVAVARYIMEKKNINGRR